MPMPPVQAQLPRNRSRSAAGWLLLGGAVCAGLAVLTLSRPARASTNLRPDRLPKPPMPTPESGTPQSSAPVTPGGELARLPPPSELDIEAAARMIQSENASASDRVKVEQIWTQIRSAKRSQTLYDRITGGHGWGIQNGKKGTSRPVSTDKPATDASRALAARVLNGELPSTVPGSRKFFEPEEQDKVIRQIERAKQALAAGKPISPNDQRLMAAKYQKTAEEVREGWRADGTELIASIEGIEFWS